MYSLRNETCGSSPVQRKRSNGCVMRTYANQKCAWVDGVDVGLVGITNRCRWERSDFPGRPLDGGGHARLRAVRHNSKEKTVKGIFNFTITSQKASPERHKAWWDKQKLLKAVYFFFLFFFVLVEYPRIHREHWSIPEKQTTAFNWL